MSKHDDDSGQRQATSAYAKDKSKVLGWVATTLGGLAVAVAVAAHNKLWAHDVELATLQTTQTAQEKRLDSIDKKLDDILAEIRKH